jgi:acetaldehyde dehydrogenase (acetylating)
MTPSRIGFMCVPVLNLEEALTRSNVNMISCGGQATAPLVHAILSVHPETEYIELVSSISSKSAGIGTRDNIDEYTETTCDALMELGGAPKAKAIVILNPADPPIMMHNTVFARIENPNLPLLQKKIADVVQKIQQYVPGYQLTLGPIEENNRITLMTEVHGQGDFLPVYAGNLDIINCAGVAVAEAYARKKVLLSS